MMSHWNMAHREMQIWKGKMQQAEEGGLQTNQTSCIKNLLYESNLHYFSVPKSCIPFFATSGLTSVRQIHSCQQINSASFTSFVHTYIALLEMACYRFFNAASGFILWETFFDQI